MKFINEDYLLRDVITHDAYINDSVKFHNNQHNKIKCTSDFIQNDLVLNTTSFSWMIFK